MLDTFKVNAADGRLGRNAAVYSTDNFYDLEFGSDAEASSDLNEVSESFDEPDQTLTSADGNVTGYTHDTTWTDANGTSTSSINYYDANWGMTGSSYTDASGYSTVSHYRTDLDADGNVTGYTHDTTWTDANGTSTSSINYYDANWGMTGSSYTDASGYSTVSHYRTDLDADGNVTGYTHDTTWTDANGTSTSSINYYDANWGMTGSSYTDASGYNTVSHYRTDLDADGNVTGYTHDTTWTDANGTSTSSINYYDANWGMTGSSYTDASGYSTVSHYRTDLDADGNVTGYTHDTTWTDANGTSTSSINYYDANWGMTGSSYTDASGYNTVSHYRTDLDADGNVTGYTHDTTWTDANGTSTSSINYYDANWGMTGSSYTDASGYSTVSHYRTDLDADGNVTGYTHDTTWTDANGTSTSSINYYDANWGMTGSSYTDASGYNTVSHYRTDLDADGNVTGYTHDTTWTDANGTSTSSINYYDANWGMTGSSYTDANGYSTVSHYRTDIDADGNVTGYTHDTTWTDANGTSTSSINYYDANWGMTGSSYTDASGYNTVSHYRTDLDADGNVTGYTHDTTWTDANGTSTSSINYYDANWGMTGSSYTDASGYSTVSHYRTDLDADGNVTGYTHDTTWTDANGTSTSSINYYDANWGMTGSSYTDASGYNTVSHYRTDLDADGNVTGYTHDTTWTDANGTSTSSINYYDANWGMTGSSYTDASGYNTVSHYRTDLDADGNVTGYTHDTTWTDANGTSTSSINYYDANWGMTGSSYTDASGYNTVSHYRTDIDADGNVTGYTHDTTWTDANGTSTSSINYYDANWGQTGSSYTDANGYNTVTLPSASFVEPLVCICFDGNDKFDAWTFDNAENGLDGDTLSVFDPFRDAYNTFTDDDVPEPNMTDAELQLVLGNAVVIDKADVFIL